MPRNEVILTSERYLTKASAQNGFQAVRNNVPTDARYSRRTSPDGRPYAPAATVVDRP
ncbi:MAG: YegP family protein [Acidobacteria bacterium]|nr:YegP family protein [Acidobacteriota bacterium]